MKTKLLSLTTGLVLCGILSFGSGLEIKFDEEQYIDNIPLNASTAFDNYFRDSLFIQECSFKNEEFTDDSISNIKKNKKQESDNLIIINLEEEEYNEYIIEQLSNTRLRNGSVKIGKEYFAKFDFKIL